MFTVRLTGKRSILLKFDRLAESEGIGANAPRRGIVPVSLCIDHIRLEGHKIQVLGPMHGNHVHATALRDSRTGTLIASDLLCNGLFAFSGEHIPAQHDTWLGSLNHLESLRPKRVVAGHSKPGLPDDDKAIDWTRRCIRDLKKFSKLHRVGNGNGDTLKANDRFSRSSRPGAKQRDAAKARAYGTRFTLFCAQ